ncbi:hypothetical protein RhiTH_009147 [Rhizoctonia solani]
MANSPLPRPISNGITSNHENPASHTKQPPNASPIWIKRRKNDDGRLDRLANPESRPPSIPILAETQNPKKKRAHENEITTDVQKRGLELRPSEPPVPRRTQSPITQSPIEVEVEAPVI